MDGVGFVLSDTTVARTTNDDDKFADLLEGATLSVVAPAGKKEFAQEINVPIASGDDSPSTAVNSDASPASIDVSSASGCGTLALVVAQSRAKAPEVVAVQAEGQTDDESDANSLAGSAVADVRPSASNNFDVLAAPGSAKPAALVFAPSSRVAVAESTPEIVATKEGAAALGGAAALHKKAVDVEVASGSGENNDHEAAPNTAVQANEPATTNSRPQPPDPSGRGAASCIDVPQQSPQGSGVPRASPPMNASAMEGVESDAPHAKAGDEDDAVGLHAMMDFSVTHGEASQRKSLQSDASVGAGESSMSVMSASGAAAGNIPQPQQSPRESDTPMASLPTSASAAEGLEGHVPHAKAGDEHNTASLFASDVTHGQAPPKKSVQSDKGACTGESSISVMSASGAAVMYIAQPQQSPQAFDAPSAGPLTKASAAEGVEGDALPAKAGGEDSAVSLLAMMDSAVTHGEVPQRESVQSDASGGAGESSMSAISAGGESRDGDSSQSLAGRAKRLAGGAKASAKGGAKALAKSEAKVAQRVSFGNVTIVNTPYLPVAKVNSDASSTSSDNLSGELVALSHASVRMSEETRSDDQGSHVGAGGVSVGSDLIATRETVDQKADLANERTDVEARTNNFNEKESVDKSDVQTNEDVPSTPITLGEVINYANELPLDMEVLKKVTEERVEFVRCGCFSRRRSALSIPGLDRRCQRDKDRVFLLTSTDFDINDTMHFRMLRTAYAKLTCNEVCPLIGEHWKALGFQNTDPRTDLNRSGRLLNVFHLFFFFTHHFDILRSAYLLAQDEEHNFPLACVCINLTRMVVRCLVEGKLSSLCNASDRDVLDTTCKIFAGSLFYFYMWWKTLNRTIHDIQTAMKEVRGLLENKPIKLLQGLAKGVEAMRQQASASEFEYTDLDFIGQAPGAGGTQPSPDAPKRQRTYTAQE